MDGVTCDPSVCVFVACVILSQQGVHSFFLVIVVSCRRMEEKNRCLNYSIVLENMSLSLPWCLATSCVFVSRMSQQQQGKVAKWIVPLMSHGHHCICSPRANQATRSPLSLENPSMLLSPYSACCFCKVFLHFAVTSFAPSWYSNPNIFLRASSGDRASMNATV